MKGTDLSRTRFFLRKTRRLLLLESLNIPGVLLLLWAFWTGRPDPWLIGAGFALMVAGLMVNALRNIRTFQLMDEYEQLTFLKAVAPAFICSLAAVYLAGMLLLFTSVNPIFVGLGLLVSFLLAFVVLGVAQARMTARDAQA
ncbi:hypothetical protein SAMN04488058_111107 [Deinococcus reticulitermitis]|uniref:Uncharacterized protein n=1 Tax=Deinococcus reticulitermitis TaxID=856736 RepID=A0A1H7AFV6_9DEIO|nr:hypothetical protein [Deinococcus reticulitermitis]SEJ59885.1 hypothetical protein SAMN04488058_111107 [Deinococcus reticulitermitis]